MNKANPFWLNSEAGFFMPVRYNIFGNQGYKLHDK